MARKAGIADYLYWLDKSEWDPIETAIILSGYEPEPFPVGTIPDHEIYEASDGIHRLIIVSINNKEISVINSPTKWLDWAISKKLKSALLDWAIESRLYTPVNDTNEVIKTSKGSLKKEQQHQFILAEITRLKYEVQDIPYGGKKNIETACLKSANLFTRSVFKRAWQAGLDKGLFRTRNSERYSKKQ